MKKDCGAEMQFFLVAAAGNSAAESISQSLLRRSLIAERLLDV